MSVRGDGKETELNFETLKVLQGELKSDIFDGQNTIESELRKSIQACNKRIKEFSLTLNKQSEILNGHQNMIKELKSKN